MGGEMNEEGIYDRLPLRQQASDSGAGALCQIAPSHFTS